jgi:predicted ester cyclase
MSEQNKQVVRRFYEDVMNAGNTAALAELMVLDFRDHGEAMFGESQGRDTLQRGVEAVHQLVTGMSVSIEHILAEGDLVGVRGRMRCVHTGPFLGVPATGRELVWKGLAIFRLEQGKIVERWFNSDSIAIYRALGLAPLPGPRPLPL